MSLLLDTHVILWWLRDDAALSESSKLRLDDDPDVYVSASSIWEIATKQAIKKLDGPVDLLEQIVGSGFRALPISHSHAMAAGRLPLHHRDPFDRILIAQAQLEGMPLMTADEQIRRYEVDVEKP